MAIFITIKAQYRLELGVKWKPNKLAAIYFLF